jgi:hypothetical protein
MISIKKIFTFALWGTMVISVPCFGGVLSRAEDTIGVSLAASHSKKSTQSALKEARRVLRLDSLPDAHLDNSDCSIVNVSSGYLIRVLLGSDTAGQYAMVDYNKSDSSFLSAYEIPSHVFRRLYASYKGLVERTSGKVFSQKWLTFSSVYRKQIDADLYFIILGIRYSDPNFPDFLTAFDAYAFPDDSTHEIRPVLE